MPQTVTAFCVPAGVQWCSDVTDVTSHDRDPLWRQVIGRAWRVPPALSGLPASADAVKLAAEAGKQQQNLAQDHHDGKDQGQHKAGRQVETVGLLLKGPAPTKQQTMEGSDQEGYVTKCGLRPDTNCMLQH